MPTPLQEQSLSDVPAEEKPAWQAKDSDMQSKRWQKGLFWALLSPVFLGLIPIFAKIAYGVGVDVLTVVTFRTLIAAIILWVGMLLFQRNLIYSSTPAILSSLFAGAINGIGSLFFYGSLTHIDASVGQLVNISYLVFVTMFLRIAGHAISWLTVFRVTLTIFAIFLLTQGGQGASDKIGVAMMVIAALTFAIQLVLSQRIMLDIPAQTMTLYAITAMALVVTAVWLVVPKEISAVPPVGWRAIVWMGLATALSRLALFMGVKNLGSIQTALLGVFEVVVTLGIASVFLKESLLPVQWLGAAVLLLSILLVRFEREIPRFVDWWQIFWRWRIKE